MGFLPAFFPIECQTRHDTGNPPAEDNKFREIRHASSGAIDTLSDARTLPAAPWKSARQVKPAAKGMRTMKIISFDHRRIRLQTPFRYLSAHFRNSSSPNCFQGSQPRNARSAGHRSIFCRALCPDLRDRFGPQRVPGLVLKRFQV